MSYEAILELWARIRELEAEKRDLQLRLEASKSAFDYYVNESWDPGQ